MRKTRTIEERLNELEDRKQKSMDKIKQLEAERKKLEQQKKVQERKIRNHRLIEIGGAVESVLKRPFGEGDMDRLLDFLHQQERRGGYFTKAMNSIPEAEPAPLEEPLTIIE